MEEKWHAGNDTDSESTNRVLEGIIDHARVYHWLEQTGQAAAANEVCLLF
jgi:hypothetical protein